MLFSKLNYWLLAACVATLVIGFILMSGGAPDDPNQFNEGIFSTRRITVAPLVVMLGFGLGFFAIIIQPLPNEAGKQHEEA